MLARWNGHVNLAKRSNGKKSHFAAAIRKYGPNAFSHDVLEVFHSLEVANLAEECWIELYGTRDPEKGFNLIKGGSHMPHPIRKNPWDDPDFRAARTAESRTRAKDPAFVAAAAAKSNALAKDSSFTDSISRGIRAAHERGSYSGLSDSIRSMWEDPGYRDRVVSVMKDSMKDPSVRTRCAPKAHANSVKTHCKSGHELPRLIPGRPRRCLVCSRRRCTEYRTKRSLG